MSNSDNNNDDFIEISRKDEGLTVLPEDDPNWQSAKHILLDGNNITELNADTLPRGLIYLDLSDNPITRVYGTFPDTLRHLILPRTLIKKLNILPENLTELVITDTPLAKKYRITSDIREKELMHKVSGIVFEPGTIMVDNTPGGRNINSNSEASNTNDDDSVNMNNLGGGGRHTKPAYNSDDTRHLVMIIEHIETEDDTKYRVQTLNDGEKLILKEYLEPYEPSESYAIKPLPLTNPPAVYTKEGHGEDILFEQPVPPGCIYVTIEECGILSSNWGKLLFAFEDKPAGIRDKLRDPIKYKKDLMAHFGRSFHVHYAGAEKRGDRTYIDSIHYPFLAWNREQAKIGKSGVLSLDDNNVFVDTSIVKGDPYDEEKVLKQIDKNNITDEDLHKLLDGSKFPTYQMVKNRIAYINEGNLTYNELKKIMNGFAFTQSWSFKMFPGIHYNFSCRDIAKHPPKNERVGRRRAISLEGRMNNINSMTDEELSGPIGFEIFAGYVDAGILPMVSKMIQKGVDVNRRRPEPDGKTLLQDAAGRFREETVRELLKAPKINKTGAVEAVEESVAGLIQRAETEEKKKNFRQEADDLIAIIKGTAGGKPNRKKTRVRSRRIRKTRRVKRFK